MAAFFRKIRQQFLNSKKIGSYLLYALGEILLVVAGILIALAINDRHEKNITREKEHQYLLGLKSEFQTSHSKLAELINVNQRNYEGATKILEYISAHDPPPSEQQWSELLYNTLAFDIAFNPNHSLLDEMIYSGSLKDISNAGLRKYLTNWIATLEDIAKQEADLAAQREQIVDMFRRNEYSIRTVLDLTGVSDSGLGLPHSDKHQHISNIKLLGSTEFENNILLFILTSRATQTAHYRPLMQDLDTILAMIDAEIRK